LLGGGRKGRGRSVPKMQERLRLVARMMDRGTIAGSAAISD